VRAGGDGARIVVSWKVEEVSWFADPLSAAARCIADSEVAWLDAATEPAAGGARYSMFCTRPVAVLEQYEQEPAYLLVGGQAVAADCNGWDLWRRVNELLPVAGEAPTGLTPGWVGYIGFEMARLLERLPATRHEDLGLPLMRLALFDRGLVLDHGEGRGFYVTAGGMPSAEDLARGAARRIGMGGLPGPRPRGAPETEQARQGMCGTGSARVAARVRPELSRRAYEQMVVRALDYIAAGDIYQVNLAQRLWIEGVGDPLWLYARVRRSNPAPYSAFLCWADGAIASFSPELFLELRGDRVVTRPIKGTRPRTGDPARDRENCCELLASAKEAAELAMIVDLHRNDLGRVCVPGSIQVAQPRRLEAHPTVFHTVADVVGCLAPGHDALDLLRACFPAGSISGVPKIRALQIIDELEPVARGAYTGAVGVLGLDGRMTFNVAIRTLQIHGPRATLYVGGGIVADSEPAAEYEETLAKARGILRGIGVSQSVPGNDGGDGRCGAGQTDGERHGIASLGMPERNPVAGR